MSGPNERPEPVDPAPDVPLDQTTAPIDYVQEGLVGDTPLDQTRSEMREVLGSEGIPGSGAPPKG